MYDLCTRPEQPPEPEPEQPPEPEPEQPPEPEPEQPVSAANTEDMEGRCHGEAEAPGQQNRIQQDRGTKTEEHGNTTTTTNGDSMDKANLDTTSTTVTTPVTPKRHNSLYKDLNDCEVGGFRKNGTDYGFLMRQNSELLRSLDEMEKTCNHLREENVLLRKSSAPETEEKVKRLRRKNIELAVIARRLEDRAHKLQEANLKMVNAPAPVEQYKRAFARQRARDLAQHADTLLSKDKEIAALQQECREMETRLGTAKGSPVPSGVVEFERLLRESQKEVLRLQRQLSISSSRVISSRVISPKDTSCKDTSCEETSFRVTSPKDISSRVTSAKDTSCKDTSSRLTSSKDTSCKDTSSRVTSSKDASPKDTSSRVTSPKAISSRVTSYKDTSCKDTSSRVTSSKDTSCKDTSSRVTSSKDTSCKDTSSRVTSPKDICSRVTSPKDPSSRVTSPKDPSSRVTFLKDASWKDTSSKDACCRVASCKDTSCKDTSCKDPSGRKHNGHERPCITKEEREEKVAAETQFLALNEAPARCEETPREEEGPRVIPTPPGPAPTPSHSHQKEHTEDQRLQLLECELSKKRKECEDLEHEVRKRQKGCLDLESQLEDERGKNGHLEEEADLLRRKAQLLDQTWVENEELREHLSEVTAQRDSGLKENQRLRVKLDNLEQVLKHMREVAERRQQLELEHEQALAILKFKQNEIKRLQRAEFFAKREHEGVVQMLETTLDSMQSKVRELEDKCHSQREQFSLLSHELETFRLQAGKLDLSGSTILTNPPLCHLTNGVGLTGDVATTLRMGANPHAAGLTRSPTVKHRELPTISLTKSSSTPKSASDTTHLSPKSAESHHSPHHSPRRTSPTPHEVDTASEVEELDIDVSPAPYTALRGASQLQVFIARYSYNPYDGPNDNPEVELPLTAGEYIYVYGGMDDDGFYEGELMDGRRGLVPSNFVERVSDDDMISAHVPEGTDISHNSLLDSSLHSASHQHHLCLGGPGTSERTDPTSAASVPVSLSVPSGEQFPSDPSLPAPLTNGLDLDLEVGVGTVPYPRKLTLIKQLAKSIIISWDGPLVPAGWGNVWSYNVYVDQELKLNVPFGSQTKAVLERLDVTLKAYRVSVQSLTERGNSDQLRCSLLVGRDVCVAPTQLRVDRVTATSASLAWLPSNSNYVHVVSLNEEEMELVKAGSYSLCLGNLTPSLQYTVKVEAQPHQTPWEIPQERREHKTATTTFTTLAAGPPDAPLGVQLEQGPSPGIALISWLPVTIDAAGTSNGVRVTGYTIYADKRKVLEVSSPTAGSALMGPSQIQSLMAAHELTVRTMSAHGESIDSVPVNVPVKLSNIMTGQASAASCSSSTPICQSTPVHQSPPYQSTPIRQSTPIYQSPPYQSPPVHQSTPVHQSPSYQSPLMHQSTPVHQSPSYQSPLMHQSTPVHQSPSYQSPLMHQSTPVHQSPSYQSPLMHQSTPVHQSPSYQSPPVHQSTPVHQSPSYQSPPVHQSTPVHQSPPYQSPLMHQSTPVHQSAPYQSPPVHQSTPVHQSPPYLSSSPPFQPQSPSYGNSAAKVSTLPYATASPPLDVAHAMGPNGALHTEACSPHPASYAEVWANPLAKSPVPPWAALAVLEAMSSPVALNYQAKLPSVPSAYQAMLPSVPSAYQAMLPSVPSAYQAMLPSVPSAYQAMLPSASHINTTSPHLGPAAATEQSRADTDRPRVLRPVMSITDFLPVEDDSRVNLSTPEPYPTPPKALVPPAGDLINPLDTQPLRPPRAPSPLESEPDYSMERPTTRLVSMEEFLSQDQDTGFNRQQRYTAGPMEPESSRGSDLSDILEEEEDDLYSDPPGSALARGYTTGANRESGRDLSMEAGAGWSGQPGLSPKLTRSEVIHQLKESMDHSWPIGDNEVRIFVALFPYDPVNMSPNPDAAEEELPFREGQIIKIYGDKDSDGFYRGESSGRHGYVPCNMVSEIQVEDEETRETLLQQGFLSTATNMEKIGTRSHAQLPRRPVPPPKPRRSRKVEAAALWEDSLDSSSQGPSQSDVATANPADTGPRRMKAIFDYDPRESSPNADIEVELTFGAGDIIYVFGDMDDDGFFYGDLNGHKGLVPSNFLQAAPEAAGKAPPFDSQPPSVAEPRTESQVSLSTFPEEVPHPPIHTGLTGPVHTHPPLHTGLTGPAHTHPPLHTELTGPVHTHPPLHTELTGPVHTHPPLHTELTGPVHTHPPLHTELTGPVHTHPPLHIELTGPVHTHPPLHIELTGPVHTHPPLHTELTGPVHTHPPLHIELTGPVHTDHQHLDPSAAAAMMKPSSMDPAPTPSLSTSPPHVPAESPPQTDVSPPGKKKKGLFSKGKKLFKKLGSSKKD
uniref:peripheral-type benzodiazepine receptor-associated protein 1-like isoform X7 n=1 Tax=Oncorhynchus gorbuscha TaxID=8017 RepID=UPI001EAEBEC7|nr:peripheral-type benzodiazepine receptor-associated protein 1-like isoform X7 [Oncorhynchus gorbuscha]